MYCMGTKVLHQPPWLDLTCKIVGKGRSFPWHCAYLHIWPFPLVPCSQVMPIHHQSANMILFIIHSSHFLGSPHAWSDRSSLIYALVDKGFFMTFPLTTAYGVQTKRTVVRWELRGIKGRKDDGGGEATIIHVLAKADSNMSTPRVSFFFLRALCHGAWCSIMISVMEWWSDSFFIGWLPLINPENPNLPWQDRRFPSNLHTSLSYLGSHGWRFGNPIRQLLLPLYRWLIFK